MNDAPRTAWSEIATGFLKIGATAFGGPAIMGVMQAEFSASSSATPAQGGGAGYWPGSASPLQASWSCWRLPPRMRPSA